MKIFLLLIFLLVELLDARSFFIIGEQHDSILGQYIELTLRRDAQNEKKIKYFREINPTQLKQDDVYMEDPYLQLYVEMTNVMFSKETRRKPLFVFDILQTFKNHLDPSIFKKIKSLFGENFETYHDAYDLGTKTDFLTRLKNFWIPLEKAKHILRTYVTEVLETKFEVKCDWNEYGLLTFRNHAWVSNLEPHLQDKNGKYVIQMGKSHVDHFISILKEKYPNAELITEIKLSDDVDENDANIPELALMKKQKIALDQKKFELMFENFLIGKKLD
jgi:hypothetical protein